MREHDVLDDGKTQAGAAMPAAARFFGAIKTLENMRQILGRNTRAGVGDA